MTAGGRAGPRLRPPPPDDQLSNHRFRTELPNFGSFTSAVMKSDSSW